MEKSKNYDQFAILRWVMVLLLVVCHYNILVGSPYAVLDTVSVSFLRKLFKTFINIGLMVGGKTPICFFVLSGLVAYRSYHGKIIKGELPLVLFFNRRLVRIYPLLFTSVWIMTFAQWSFLYLTGSWWTDRPASIWHLLAALSGFSVGTFVHVYDAINGPIWYLSVLMVCYGVFWYISALGLANGKKVFAYPIMVGLSIQSYGINLPFLNASCATGYIGFFTGVLLAVGLENKKIRKLLLNASMIYLIIFMGGR